MSVMTQLSLVGIRYVVGGASKAAGVPGGEKAVDFLVERFSDPSQRLPQALAAASDRAWKTLELTLAGDSLWSRLTAKGEDRKLAEQLRAAFAILNKNDALGNQAEFFRACLKDLKAARKSSVLSGAPPQPDELRRHCRTITNYADPTALVEAEWQSATWMGEQVEAAGHPTLAKFLRLRAGELPFLTVAVRYYFRQAVAKDRELFQGLTFAKLEAVGSAQEEQFATLAETLETNAGRLEEALADVLAVAEDTRAGVLRIEDEMGRQGAEGREFYQAVIQRLDRLEMRGAEVRPSDGMSIRSDDERQKVREFLKQYRAMPDDARRERPALLDAVAKLEFAAGDFEQAQADFALLPTMLDDTTEQAQAHFNAYRAALERAGRSGDKDDWRAALLELVAACKLDKKYMPFDARKYAPSRILGAGGFGVTFLCKHKELDDDVAVKALLAEELQLDASKVFSEGRLLRKIDHPAIIRMQDCGFADPEGQSRPYLVMDFFEGQTLESHVADNGTLSLDEGVALARLLADGMKAAHGQGVLHRDLKPANVMVRKEKGVWRAKIIDFGLALKRETVEAAAAASTSLRSKTLAGTSIAGTVDYAAPEQMGKLPGVAVGPYSDVYGWGKTVCYALFKTPTPVTRHFKSKNVPESLRELLEGCLDEEPQHRPQTFEQVLKRIDKVELDLTPELDLIEEEPVKPVKPPAVKWFYMHREKEHGPFSEEELRELVADGTVGPDTDVWRKGMPEWIPARKVEGLVPKVATAGATLRVFSSAEQVTESSFFGFGQSDNRKTLQGHALKVYIDGKYQSEGNRLTGFDHQLEIRTGRHTLAVALWKDNQEADRREFKIDLPKSGFYEMRFNLVYDPQVRLFGEDTKHIQKSTLETLKEPGGPSADAAGPPPLAPRRTAPSGVGGTKAVVTFVVPPTSQIAHTAGKAIRGYLKLATYGLAGGKVFGSDHLKFLLGDRLLGEGPLVDGFEFTAALPLGPCRVAVAHWVGTSESSRKEFNLDLSAPGEYSIRFLFVRGTLGGMSGSSIEILTEPS